MPSLRIMRRRKTLCNTNTPCLQSVLTALMDECDIDHIRLSQQTGVPASTISRMRTHQEANPTISSLMPISKFFQISINQLLGEDPLPITRIPGTFNKTSFTSSRLPIITWANLEYWAEHGEHSFKPHLTSWISTEKDVSDTSFALIIPSNSLGITFQKGSLAITDPQQKPQDGDFVLFQAGGKNPILLRQVIKDGAETYIKSVNPEIKGTKPVTGTDEFKGMIVETRFDFNLGTQLDKPITQEPSTILDGFLAPKLNPINNV